MARGSAQVLILRHPSGQISGNTILKIRTLTAALLGTAALACASAPLQAQDKPPTTVAAAEPAVPNTPRAVTPASMAAPPLGSPDASQIDASDGKTDPLAADPTTA